MKKQLVALWERFEKFATDFGEEGEYFEETKEDAEVVGDDQFKEEKIGKKEGYEVSNKGEQAEVKHGKIDQNLQQEFELTTQEINYLIQEPLILKKEQKEELSSLLLQDCTSETLKARNKRLEEINGTLAGIAINDSLASRENNQLEITASFLGLSRIPQNLLNFILEHQHIITAIHLKKNNLSFLPECFMKIPLPKVKVVDLSLNHFSAQNENKLKEYFLSKQKEERVDSMTEVKSLSFYPSRTQSLTMIAAPESSIPDPVKPRRKTI